MGLDRSASGVRIEVDPDALIGAGKQIGSLGTQLGLLSDALGGVVSHGIASGTDPAGLNYGLEYGDQAQLFADGLADAANAFKSVGFMLEATGYNYKNADASSTVGGPGPSGGVGAEPEQTTAADAATGPNGTTVPPPTKWHLIVPFLNLIPGGAFAGAALTWPSGSPGMLRLTATQWRNLGQGLSIFDDAVTPVRSVVAQQQIPEGGRIGELLGKLSDTASKLSTSATGIGQSIDGFATGVEETQDAIRRLLDRISLGGAWDMVKGVFTGEADDILREVAHDVGTVLKNFQNQVKGVVGLLGQLGEALGDAVTALQNWVRPHLVELLGDDVGNALADGFTLYTDFQVGLTTGLINTVASTVALADPDTWKGMAEVALSVAQDPSTLPDVLANMGKEFVAWDKWSGDHPGRAAGEAAFNIGSLFVPGGALSKTGTLAKGLRATRGLLDEGKIPGLRGLGSGRHTPSLDNMPDLEGVGSGVRDIPEVRPPGIPESVLSPTAPNGVDAPSAPRGLEGPAGPPDPPGPAATPGGGGDTHASPGGGDGPPPGPPGTASGPPDSAAGPPSSESPGTPGPSEPPAPNHAAVPNQSAAPHDAPSQPNQVPSSGGHSEAGMAPPPNTHSGDHAPSTHESQPPQTNQTPSGGGHPDAGTTPPPNTHPGDHAPSQTGTSAGEHNGHAGTPPAEHHNGQERPAADANPAVQQPHTPDEGNGGHRDSGNGSAPPPAGMAGVAPMAPHGPFAAHGAGATHGPDASARPPETRTPDARAPEARTPDTRAPHAGTPENTRTQQPSATGPAPGHTPTAPVSPAKEQGANTSHQPANTDASSRGSRPVPHDALNPSRLDASNNPPHTGLHDPPANHGIAGDSLPDLTDIDAEYRLADGSVDPDRFEEWTRAVAGEYPRISQDGVAGVYDYTTENYQGMNPYLRDVDPLSPQQQSVLGSDSIDEMTDAQRISWEERISDTDDGLAALPPYRADPSDATSSTWRGMHASEEVLAQLEVGGTFSDAAYLSTSLDPEVARTFALSADPDRTPTLLQVGGYNGVDVSQLSRYTEEAEILFPRGSEFRVISRLTEEDGVVRIMLEQLQP